MNDMKSEESAETGTAGRAGPESGRAVSRSGANRDLEGLVEEARALALYVSRHGDVLPEDRHDLHEELLEAIAKAVDDPSTAGWKELMGAYARVTALTYRERGVNGRTILDTRIAANTAL